jgi:hypothetical protein
MGITAEVIATFCTPSSLLKITATNAPNPRILAISIEQIGTIRKKVDVWDTVVLENDSFLHMLIKPADCVDWTHTASLINIGIKAMDLTWPINILFDDLPRCCHHGLLILIIRGSAIAGNIQTCGLQWSNRSNNLPNAMGSSIGNQKKRASERQ